MITHNPKSRAPKLPLIGLPNIKVNAKAKSGTCYSTAYMRDSVPEALYNLGRDS